MTLPFLSITALGLMTTILGASQPAHSKEQSAAVSASYLGALMAGRYSNPAQVAQGKATGENPPPQHVTITIEPTQQPGWEFWHVHMDVDPAVAEEAGSATSLDAIWAMHLARDEHDRSFQLIPFSLNPAVDAATVKASAFDRSQWLSLDACALRGDFGRSHISARAPADEMCVAATMGLGGKRAFLPLGVERAGDWLHVQITYFGKPWRVDARRE
jgi:hypothetical protein